MHCFYADSLTEARVLLGEEESAHCARVLRLGVGEEVLLTDGAGTLAHGRLAAIERRGAEVEIVQREGQLRRRGQQTILAVAPTKNASRMEWLVEKVTEVGCGAVVLLQCERGVRTRLNEERLRRVALAALKQSQGAYLPKIWPMQSLCDFLSCRESVESQLAVGREGGAAYLRAVAHCGDGARLGLRGLLTANGERPLEVLIGPEGDFSEAEVAQAQASGFEPVSLGEARLRTETAALVAATLAAV